MEAHHHHHHHQPSTCCTPSLSHGCSFNCNQTHHQCHSHPFHSVDPLLESLASQQLHAQTHRFHGLRSPNNRSHHQDQRSADLLISSLVSRIEAMEASLSRPRGAFGYGFRSLREVAARVIQTHFRAFLVRRSRTLGQLKELAIVKTCFSSLRSSISDQTRVDLYSVSRKAVDLLVKLDSIQSDDCMVRDGKRSLSRDLVGFLDFVEGVSVKRHELYLKAKKKKNNVRSGQSGDNKHRAFVNRTCNDLDLDRREIIGKLRERVEKIRGYTRFTRNGDEDVVLEGFQHVGDDEDEEGLGEGGEGNPVVVIREKGDPIRNGVFAKKKSVSFAENRNVLKLFSDSDESIPNEDGTHCLDGDGSTSSEDNNNHEVEEIKVFSLGTEDGPLDIFDEKVVSRIESRLRKEGNYKVLGRYENDDGDYLFSAPLPVQMEEKSELLKRRNEAKSLR